MQAFVDRHQDRLTGVLTGFDRVLFRGNLQSLSCLDQRDGFLLRHRIPSEDSAGVVQTISDRAQRPARPFADDHGRPYVRDRGDDWTICESEVATDVMLRDAKTLAEVDRDLADHALRQFDSQDVMRFLGRRADRRFQGQVTRNGQPCMTWVRMRKGVADRRAARGDLPRRQ